MIGFQKTYNNASSAPNILATGKKVSQETVLAHLKPLNHVPSPRVAPAAICAPAMASVSSQQSHDKLIDIEKMDLQHTLMNVASQAVGSPTEQSYPWAAKNNLYVRREALAENIISSSYVHDDILIVDVRDEDAIGGSVVGALHFSDQSLAQPDMLAQLASKALDLGPKGTIVFHCMESLRRGPRCAQRLTKILELAEKDLRQQIEKPSIHVLEGGADQWMRHYWDTDLVENYDDIYWGFKEFQSMEAMPSILEQPHKLYEIQVDELHPKLKTLNIREEFEKSMLNMNPKL